MPSTKTLTFEEAANIERDFRHEAEKIFRRHACTQIVRQREIFSALSLPSFMRDWLVMRFADEAGHVDTEEISAYVKKKYPEG